MLDGLTSGLIDQSKAGKTLFILHSYAELFISDPVLQTTITQITDPTNKQKKTNKQKVINDDDHDDDDTVLGTGRTDWKGQE